MTGEMDRANSPTIDSDASDDGEWLDVEPDEEAVTVVSLFDSQTFATLDEMLGHCKQHHGFDLRASLLRLQLDFLGAVKLVNFIRHRVRQGQPLPDTISLSDIQDDAYLKPVLENDAVLFSLDDILDEAAVDDGAADGTGEQTTASRLRNSQLEAELESIRDSFANYRLAVQQTLDRRWGDDDDDTNSRPAASSSTAPAKDSSDYYFESYAYNGTSCPRSLPVTKS